jgi:hypothetical protein
LVGFAGLLVLPVASGDLVAPVGLQFALRGW